MRNQPKNSGKRSSGCVEARLRTSVLLAHPEALASQAFLLFSPATNEPVMRWQQLDNQTPPNRPRAHAAPVHRPAVTAGGRHVDWTLWSRLLAVSAIWGGTFLAGRLIAAAMPASIGALLRFVVASVALWLAARWLEGGLPRLNRRQWLSTAALGASGILTYNLFFFGALAHLPASRTSLLVALNPVA